MAKSKANRSGMSISSDHILQQPNPAHLQHAKALQHCADYTGNVTLTAAVSYCRWHTRSISSIANL